MIAKKTFGSYFKDCRIELGITLREFCKKHGLDPGNTSKLERGLLPPPQDREKLEEYARALGLKKGTARWLDFFDIATTAQGRVPDDLLSDEEVVKRLPLLFRTLRGKRSNPKQFNALIKLLRKS